MSKAEEFLRAQQRPKSGLTQNTENDISYFSEMADTDTENHVKGLQSGEANIMVSVRIRPISKTDQKKGLFPIVKAIDSKFVTVQDPMTIRNDSEFASNQVSGGVKEKQYAFDYVFDEDTEQKTVFDKTTKFLVEGVVDGYNATVFTYGATGAGKTFTMLGKPGNQGIFGYAFEELFEKMEEESKEKDFKIKMSFVEIYNEMIFDLLLPNEKALELREDAYKGIHIAGVSEIRAESPKEVLELLHLGNQNRSTESTDANDESSRSHAILLVTCEHKERDSGVEAEVKVGKFSLIDLAGSERAANTNNTGLRMVEGANINRSLLSLGNCITLLYQNSEKKTKNYIPYRDSKLTRLLKDSLGGNSRTVMIANVSPSNSNYDETSNTLKYASRAKNIKTDVKRNVLSVSFHVSKYQSIISNLKKQVAELKDGINHQETSFSMSKSPKKDQDTKVFDQIKSEMELNFHKEIENRRIYMDNERTALEAGMKLFQHKSDFEKSNRENGKAHVRTKQAEDNLKNEQKIMEK
jgi:kinesin family protein 18/19